MLKVERFVNELMSSNCYMVWDDASLRCLVIDPASEKSLREIEFIESHNLTLDFILLTHEHTDHTWGVNSLIDAFPNVKVIATQACKDELPKTDQAYFRLYYDDPDYRYIVRRVDITTEDIGWELEWNGGKIHFIYTPGHSVASMCIAIEDNLFTGDTIMNFKPFIKKINKGSWEEFNKSVSYIKTMFPTETKVFPGHGINITLKEHII